MIGFYRDRRGEWRWRVTADNGRIVAVSSEGYQRRIDAIAGAVVCRDVLQAAESLETGRADG